MLYNDNINVHQSYIKMIITPELYKDDNYTKAI